MTGSLGEKTKDPADIRIFGIEWSAFLAARSATISTSSWSVSSGLTKVSDSTSGTQTLVKVSGGSADQDYIVTTQVVLSNGETVGKSFKLQVREQ
jgi:hypothetical protein